MDTYDVVTAYYRHELDLDDATLCDILLSTLHEMNLAEIIELISKTFNPFKIVTIDIPQFSSLEDCFNAPMILSQSGMEKVDFIKMGYLLSSGIIKKQVANQKYGENHGKMAVLFGLLKLNPRGKIDGEPNNKKSFSITELGKNFIQFEGKNAIKSKLLLRSKLIQNYFLRGRQLSLLEAEIACNLSDSTYKRRMSNINTMINCINNEL